MPKKILFIHHGTIAGGAPLSMLYTMKGALEAGYEPIAALRRPMAELHQLYNEAGFSTIEVPWVPFFITSSGSEGKWWNPITWKGVYDAFKVWNEAKEKLKELVNQENIDLVHLNSVGLSNCAEVLMEMNHPFVWHVREHGPIRQGMRYKRIRSRLRTAKNVIFLSKAEQLSWLGGDQYGTVVHNFINFKKFSNTESTEETRRKLGLSPKTKTILYVGGSKSHKGVLELLSALGKLKLSYNQDFICLMPDSEVKNPKRLTKIEAKMAKLIRDLEIGEECRMLPFSPDIVNLFTACDVLVFPATKPHFARPVIEASAMGRPVIASNLKAIDELVIDEKTGFLVKSGDIDKLVEKLVLIFENPSYAEQMGKAGIAFALAKFEQKNQMKKITAIYERALSI